MKKHKNIFIKKDKFISPKSYIKKPNPENDLKERLKSENLQQTELINKYQKERLDKYNKQQSDIATGQMPTKTSQEIKALTRSDPFRRVKSPFPKPAPMYSKEQQFIRTFFGQGDHVIFNSRTSDSLPHMQGHLNPRAFNPEEEGTAQTFGFGVIKHRTGLY